MCLYITDDGEEDRFKVRYRKYSKLMVLVEDQHREICSPETFCAGNYMAIDALDEESIFGEGVVDFE